MHQMILVLCYIYGVKILISHKILNLNKIFVYNKTIQLQKT